MKNILYTDPYINTMLKSFQFLILNWSGKLFSQIWFFYKFFYQKFACFREISIHLHSSKFFFSWRAKIGITLQNIFKEFPVPDSLIGIIGPRAWRGPEGPLRYPTIFKKLLKTRWYLWFFLETCLIYNKYWSKFSL